MHTRYLQRTILAALCLLFAILSPLGNANTLYAVSLDTTVLVGDEARPFRPFTLDFILRDGSGTTIQLTDFNFLEGSFKLTDTSNETMVPFTQSGEPLPKLSFRVDTTNNPASPESDSFIFKILNKNGTIPTTDLTNNSFLTIVLNPAPGKVSSYGTPDGAIGAPTVQLLSPTNVPEPPTSLLLAMGLGGLLATWRSLRFGVWQKTEAGRLG